MIIDNAKFHPESFDGKTTVTSKIFTQRDVDMHPVPTTFGTRLHSMWHSTRL